MKTSVVFVVEYFGEQFALFKRFYTIANRCFGNLKLFNQLTYSIFRRTVIGNKEH